MLSERGPYSEKIFQFIEKMIFELLPWGKETQEGREMTALYVRMLRGNKNETLKFISERILNKDEKG
jgi:hypothetical protein